MAEINVTTIANSKVKENIEIPEDINILEDGQQVPTGHYVFRILCQEKGDERLTWDSTSLAEIQAAKQLFVDLIKKGLKPFKVGISGKPTSEVMDKFDPSAEEVIFIPQAMVAGG